MAVQFKHQTLPNGLTVIAETNSDAHTAAVGFFVRTGTRDEPAEWMGVSHFLEHMMFKGTARRTAEQVNQEFDRIGANYNASTSQEVTNYWAHVLPEYFSDAIDLLADILRPSLRDDDFDVEKKVILEEIGMYADRPFWVLYEHAMEKYFDQHPLGFRILGTNESITALRGEQMRRYFDRQYGADNVVVAMSGRLDFDRCAEQLAAATAHWSSTGVGRQDLPIEARPLDEALHDEKLNRHYTIAIMPGPSHQDDERYAAAVLANLLGDADGSRLYWDLIDPGLADEAELHLQPFDGLGAFMLSSTCDPQRAEQVEVLIMQTLDRAGDDLVDEEIERARNKIAMSLTLRDEQPLGRMAALGRQWLYLGEQRSLAEELHRITSITSDDLGRLLERYPLRPRTVIRMTSGK